MQEGKLPEASDVRNAKWCRGQPMAFSCAVEEDGDMKRGTSEIEKHDRKKNKLDSKTGSPRQSKKEYVGVLGISDCPKSYSIIPKVGSWLSTYLRPGD